ncbi:MAG: cbb3-type cytochrome oxidase assembly protein CcoS [Alphaproteobacteria bacterium]|nr:cbb3-type cytochrome oxidase assembly protein CcoS [Alphaproteobacteria bacterium]
MDILLVLMPVALLLGAVFAWLFVRAARSGQFEDLDDPAIRMLQDD